ncbi:type II secretion system protein J [Sporosarcina sp. JAI121]|uniref:PulJ/GspJ family protein n=1 Tax=Sporosarcina sp. JAI121 TaxID=2723064 RepID=UPI0015C83C1D|nr:prepilin-type N-terminal cleavage/methylation domain-containing protein [Sporosarcina sp. JAI121]NYF25031.1 type II secretory pathway pseudopilin PulG [Sporosarcina sp. JAI121]
MKKVDERGITLVELLATIVLVSIVMVLIWNTISISMKYNLAETKKLHLQQEANYIITEIQRIHRQCDSYQLTITGSEVSMKKCVGGNQIPDEIVSNIYHYIALPEYKEEVIEAKIYDSTIDLKLTVQDIQNKKLKVEVQTTISRYKSIQ